MSIGDLISIITICVTLLLGIGGFIFNTYMQRKNNSITVITGYRLERRQKMLNLVSILLSNSDPYYIESSNEIEKKNIIKELSKASNEFRTIFVYSFEKDKHFIQLVYSFRKLVYNYITNNSVTLEELKEAREELAKECDIYSATDWKRIKLETVGKTNNRFISTWTSIFDEYKSNYPKDKSDK